MYQYITTIALRRYTALVMYHISNTCYLDLLVLYCEGGDFM